MKKREAEELLELSRKATLGPWNKKGLHVYAGDRGYIAQIPRPQNGGVFECTANAELIPELRNRVESLVQMLQQAAEMANAIECLWDNGKPCDCLVCKWLSEWNKPEPAKGEEPKP